MQHYVSDAKGSSCRSCDWAVPFDNAAAERRDAFAQSLEGCRQYLLLIARRELQDVLPSKADASDLVQDTLLEAHAAFDGFRGKTQQELLAWMRRILLNNIAEFKRHYLRTEKRRAGREVPIERSGAGSGCGEFLADGASTPSLQAIRAETAERVRQALSRLAEDHRAVIEFRHRDQMKFAEIGRLMNRSADAARMLWSRAMERLAHELESDASRR